MTTFSATDAALEGFRLTRERLRTVLVWGGFQFALSVVMALLMIKLGGQSLMALEEAGSDADPAMIMQQFRELGPLYAVLLPLGLLVLSVSLAAVYRAVLTPEDSRNFYLRFGPDEARLAALTVVYFFLWSFIVFVVVLSAGMVAALAAAVLGPAGGLAGLAVGLFATGLVAYIVVRLSLSHAITFGEKRISVFGSWRMTRGVFWKLLGAYLLATAAMVVVGLLALVIFTSIGGAVVLSMGGQIADVGKMFAPDPASLSSYFTVATVIYLAFGGLLQAVYYAVIFAPAAVAYKALRNRTDLH